MENKKWTFTVGYGETTHLLCDSIPTIELRGASDEEAQQICDALNDARPWRTGVPDKDGYYEVTISDGTSRIDVFEFERGWKISFRDSQLGLKILAYRPLPDPYDPNKK